MEIFSGYCSSPSNEVSPVAEMAIFHTAVAGGPFSFCSSNSLFTNEDGYTYNRQTRTDETNGNNASGINNKLISFFVDIKMLNYIDTNSGYYMFDDADDMFFVYVVMPNEGQFV